MMRKRLLALLLAALTALALAGCGGGETVYQDYASAGTAIREELAGRETPVRICVNTKEYSPLLRPQRVWDSIVKEAGRHTGDPMKGDHIAMSVLGYSMTYTEEKKDDGSYDLKMTAEPIYDTTAEQEQELKAKAEEILRSLDVSEASDYETVRAIYGWICENVVYDYEHLEAEDYYLHGSAYAAAVNGTAVCAGIADLFYILANEAGLDARIITNSNHAWNFVQVDGKYYYADATWDLGKSEAEYEYFLKGSLDFDYHMGNVTFGPSGFSNILNHSDLGYDFSMYAYGA